MKLATVVLGIGIFVLLVGHANALEAMPKTNVSMEVCLDAALKTQPGEVKELEFGLEDGVPHYEFEIITADGRETEVECDAMTGRIIEVEWENEHMNVDAFLEKATVSPSQARKIALQRVPGSILKMDLETNSMGVMSYEFEVATRDGKQLDVEVDATSGRIIEVEQDIYEIGDLAN
ncbi:MAG: peptidase [Burkholderiales bacterium]|nr:peptidase [Burkholderiales bacterium]